MDRLFKLAAVASLSLALFGCSEVASTNSSPKEAIPSFSSITKGSLVDLERVTSGFEAGSSLSIRKIYIFFDPQCPHCAALWNETKKLSSHAKYIWIPVSIMNNNSLGQGAAILSAEDSVEFMDNHGKLLMQNRQGAPAMKKVPAELRDSIKRNTEVLKRLGANSVPYVVGINPLKNEVVKITGGLPAEEFARRFGWSY